MSAEARCEELEAIQAIYSDCVDIVTSEEGMDTIIVFTYSANCVMKFELPQEYPDDSDVVLKFQKFGYPKGMKMKLLEELNSIIETLGGAEILFNLIMKIKEVLDDCTGDGSCVQLVEEDHESDADDNFCLEAAEFKQQLEESTLKNNSLPVVHGEFMTFKKSTFQSHFARVSSMDEVNLFRMEVLSDKRVARATHNIFAYRFIDPATGVSYHDNDDDGESAAGGRLAEMIRLMKVEGIAVIVTRWFGGVLLGPDRFKYICNSARQLLETQLVDSDYVETRKAKR
jgi:hypothetical protein